MRKRKFLMPSQDTRGEAPPVGPDTKQAEPQRRGGWRSLRSKFFASGILLLMTVLTTLMLFLPFLNYELDLQIDQQERFNQDNIAQEAETIARLLVFELSRIEQLWDVKYYARDEIETLSGALAENLAGIISLNPIWIYSFLDLQDVLNNLELTEQTRTSIRTYLWEKTTFNSIIRDIELLDDTGYVLLTPFKQDWERNSPESADEPGIEDYLTITAPAYVSASERETYYVFMPLYIEGNRWGVVKIAFSTEDIRRQLQRQAAEQDRFRWLTGLFFIGTLALSSIVGVLVLSLLARRITEPLKLLARNAEVFAESGDAARLQRIETEEDEVGLLAQSFTRMADDINRLLMEKDEAYSALQASQEQLRQSERLASLGQLSGGIAHEINNALSPIRLRAEEVLMTIDEGGHAERQDLQVILKGIEQCTAIVTKLRDFAAPQLGERALVDLNEVIRETVVLVRRQIERRNIRLDTSLDPIPKVLASAVELEQVFMNLLLNARDAIEAKGTGDGLITISTAVADGAVTAEIADNGIGMDQETQSKIFEPFFSTKPVGQGTGLGLSVSFGIIQSHGASIKVKSKPGMGTSVVVRFPMPPSTNHPVEGNEPA
jgi:signal transduction histidine kinase